MLGEGKDPKVPGPTRALEQTSGVKVWPGGSSSRPHPSGTLQNPTEQQSLCIERYLSKGLFKQRAHDVEGVEHPEGQNLMP